MNKRRWQPDEVERVREWYASGEDDAAIAAALGRSVGSVSNLRQAKGIQRPRETLKRGADWSDEELALAADMYAKGESNNAIATALGRSRIAIKRLVTTHGLRRSMECLPEPSKYDTENEKWRLVRGGLPYAVSSIGRVMSLLPGRMGEHLSTWMDEGGYVHVQLQVDGKSKRHSVHRLIAHAFRGDPPTALHQAAHNDGNPSNNSDENIRWATPAENQADRLIHGTAERGPGGQFIGGTADMIRQAEAAGVPVVRVPTPHRAEGA